MVCEVSSSRVFRNRNNTWPLYSRSGFETSYNEFVAALPRPVDPSLSSIDDNVEGSEPACDGGIPVEQLAEDLPCLDSLQAISSSPPPTPELSSDPTTPQPELDDTWRENVAPELLSALYEVQERFKTKMTRLSAVKTSKATIETSPTVDSLNVETDYINLEGTEEGFAVQYEAGYSDPFIFDRWLGVSELSADS